MGNLLTYENFQSARKYLMNDGRKLEQELFRFYFENGSPRAVISALKEYQRKDGGFRNMGEGHSDITNGMDTIMAFQYLNEVDATAQDKIVQKGIKYIIESYDLERRCWHGRPNETCEHWLDNPCAELLGYLYEYRELVPDDFLKDVTQHALASMTTIRTTEEPQQFYFLTALSLLRLAVRIDEPFKTQILKQLQKDIYQIIETNSEKWATTYCAKPFLLANSPDSPMFLAIKDHVIRSLENEIRTQSEDGHFILNWYVEDAAGARVWNSIWTMDALRALHFHGMIKKNKNRVVEYT